MAYDRFLVGPLNVGLQRNMKPWLLPDDAFPRLQNAYIFRQRLRKRFGSKYMGSSDNKLLAPLNSRLRISLGTTNNVTGNFGPTVVPGATGAIGQAFSVGNQIFTVHQTTGSMFATTGTGTGTFDTTTGTVTITGATTSATVYFYPALPVMGITTYQAGNINVINNQPSYAFDTKYAYRFNGNAWDRSGSGSNPVWHGNDLNFFWEANWEGQTADDTALFVTNYNAAVGTPVPATDDPIWVTDDGITWSTFNPVFLSTGAFVQTALIIVCFKNRLLLLNTIENDNDMSPTTTAYKNRLRYSFNGSPFATNAWLEPNQTFSGTNAAGGGFLDATTEESIIGAEFIKDRLIVYFQRSTWEIAYTGNEILPFVWQKINTELGSEATFSSVPFDKVILTVGNTGVHACNGSNVERIDNLIPDEVFEIKDKSQGSQRVAGIRDYFTEMVYWTFPLSTATQYPNKILVYNYKTGSWAINDDCITTWGYFEQQQDTTWNSTTLTWETINSDWISGINQAQFRQIIAGNQEGYVFIIDPELSRNAGVMQITNAVGSDTILVLTVIDHTLQAGDYVYAENTPTEAIGVVASVTDSDTIIVDFSKPILSGSYTGGGVLTRVSNIDILTKEFNPYVSKARDVNLARVDFYVTRTTNGQVSIDYYPSSAPVSLLEASVDTGTILGTGILETSPYATIPIESLQERLWHPVYLFGEGESVQLRIYMNSDQILDPSIAFSDFELHAMMIYTRPTTDRLQ